jgi:hypothetical protein
MTLANRVHRAGLPPLLPLGYGQADLVADLQAIEAAFHDAIAVEIDFLTIRGLDEAEALFTHVPCDTPVQQRGLMMLCLAAQAADMVLKLPDDSVERIPHCDVRILVRVILRALSRYHDVAPGNHDLNAYPIEAALMMVSVRLFYGNYAAQDIALEAFKPRCLLADACLQCG